MSNFIYNPMKYIIYIIPFLIILFLSCKNNEKEERVNLCQSSECNVINDVFLDLVGTWDYYEHTDIEEAGNALGHTDPDKIMKYLRQNKEITKRELVVFYADEFLSNGLKQGQRDSLEEDYREIIRLVIDWNDYITTKDFPGVMKELSVPMILDYSEVSRTGRYNLVPIEQKENIKEDTKAEKIIAISNIHFNEKQDKAFFYYEIGCLDGYKCSEGNVAVCQKTDEGWKVVKKFNIWVS